MREIEERGSEVIERVGCSWQREDRPTSTARRDFADSAAFHDAHGDDLSKCDSWVCVCGRTDSRGGSWEQLEVATPVRGGARVQLRCTECGRVYDDEGVAVTGRGGSE
jgi:hypothetical protein